MAYAASITKTTSVISGRRIFEISVTETEAAATSEFEITGLPEVCTLVLYRATRTAGTGTTIAPVGGATTSFTASSQNENFSISAAAHVSESTRVPLRLTSNKLVIRSTPNDSTADHTISPLITIAEGVV